MYYLNDGGNGVVHLITFDVHNTAYNNMQFNVKAIIICIFLYISKISIKFNDNDEQIGNLKSIYKSFIVRPFYKIYYNNVIWKFYYWAKIIIFLYVTINISLLSNISKHDAIFSRINVRGRNIQIVNLLLIRYHIEFHLYLCLLCSYFSRHSIRLVSNTIVF